jgi:ribosome-associated translation inhibitor RaiA
MPTATGRKLQVIFDVHQYRLSQAEEQLLHENLDGLARQVENFPVADLHVLIEGNARSNDVSVKLTLRLPGTTLVNNDHDAFPQPAFDRCLDSLLDSLHAYKERLGQVPERQKTLKGTHQEVHPEGAIDAEALRRALDAGDYAEFRAVLLPFDEIVRKRVGRWIQRYPEVEAQIGIRFEIADMVEEVFLQAFETYDARPVDVTLGDWLEGLIDPAVKELRQRGDAELENVAMARAAAGVDTPPAAARRTEHETTGRRSGEGPRR